MASEQGGPGTLPSGIEEWISEHTDNTGDSRETVLARAVASYRLLSDGRDENDAVENLLSDLESRVETLESASEADRIDQLEADLDEHVEDLRSRIVDVIKEARKRAPADHSHEDLEDRLTEVEGENSSVQSQVAAHESTIDELRASTDQLEAEIAELGSLSDSVDTVESKADRLAGVVVDLRRRLGRVESHITHQTALAELLETAAREDIEKAQCDNCDEMIKLPMLVEPACPHCRSVFDGIEPAPRFYKSASLTVADRPALEAGTTTETPFGGGQTADNTTSSSNHGTNR